MKPEPSHPSRFVRAASWLAVLHPVLFAIAYVLDRLAITNTVLPEATRPMLVLIGGAGVLTLLLWAFLRNRYWAALVASTCLLVLVIHPVPALVMVVLVTWSVGVRIIRRRREPGREPLTSNDLPVRLASAYAIVLVLGGLWTSWDAFTVGIDPPRLPAPTARGGPNIYVLLLDGYPRGDTLAELGHDNSSFEQQLEDLGFTVSEEARSNHNKTWLTVASMLHADYIVDLPQIASPPESAPAQVRLAHALINESAVLDYLRRRDYEVVSIPSAVMSTDVTATAEVWVSPHLNQFEIALLSASLPAFVAPQAVLDFIVDDMRAQMDDQLEAMVRRAESPTDGPQIVLTHLMSPHPPFVLGQEPEYLHDCFPACKVWETTLDEAGLTEAEYADRMSTQTAELNQRTLAAVDRIATADPEAIVLVMSDHGARLETEASDEHFRILFALRSPTDDGAFGQDATPANAFRRILSRSFGEDVGDLPYRAWASDWNLPLLVTPFSRSVPG